MTSDLKGSVHYCFVICKLFCNMLILFREFLQSVWSTLKTQDKRQSNTVCKLLKNTASRALKRSNTNTLLHWTYTAHLKLEHNLFNTHTHKPLWGHHQLVHILCRKGSRPLVHLNLLYPSCKIFLYRLATSNYIYSLVNGYISNLWIIQHTTTFVSNR